MLEYVVAARPPCPWVFFAKNHDIAIFDVSTGTIIVTDLVSAMNAVVVFRGVSMNITDMTEQCLSLLISAARALFMITTWYE